MFVPHIVCAIHAKQTISVLLKSVPLNRSLHLVPSVISFSSSLVYSIIAIVSSALNSVSLSGDVRRSNATRAPSRSPRRTCHHGLSGARNTPIMSGTGHIHWIAKGIRYDHSSSRVTQPRLTPAAMNCPITQHLYLGQLSHICYSILVLGNTTTHILTKVVSIGLSRTGLTSEAYCVVNV